MLLNAAPDLRAQIEATPALHPRPGADGIRHSPIAAAVLTGAEVDTIAGLLTLREGHAFALYGAAPALEALADNPIFLAVNPTLVPRRMLPLDVPLELADASGQALGLTVEAFAVPGKVPLFREAGEDPGRADDGETIGLRVAAGGAGAVLHPRLRRHGAVACHPAEGRRLRAVRRHALARRRDDPRRRRAQDGRTHGPYEHVAGRTARSPPSPMLGVRRKHLHPHQQHQPGPAGRQPRARRGRRPPAGRSPRTAWRSGCDYAGWDRAPPLSPDELEPPPARHRRRALPHPPPVPPPAARRPAEQGPGAGLGAEPLLLPGRDPGQGRLAAGAAADAGAAPRMAPPAGGP